MFLNLKKIEKKCKYSVWWRKKRFYIYVQGLIAAPSSPIYCWRVNGYRCRCFHIWILWLSKHIQRTLGITSGPSILWVSGSPEVLWTMWHNHIFQNIIVLRPCLPVCSWMPRSCVEWLRPPLGRNLGLGMFEEKPAS